jgi:hypothetical protein
MALATEWEAAREEARNVGAEQPDRAWILTQFDSWEPNPFYHGPAVPHPECEDEEDHLGALAAEAAAPEFYAEFDGYDNEIPF